MAKRIFEMCYIFSSKILLRVVHVGHSCGVRGAGTVRLLLYPNPGMVEHYHEVDPLPMKQCRPKRS